MEIEKEKEKIQRNSNQIELLRKSLERDNSKLTAEAESIVSDAKLKARNILIDAKEEANEIIKELNKSSITTQNANSMRNKLNSSIANLSQKDNNITNIPSKKLEAKDISIGLEVMCNNLHSTGTILSMPNRSNEVKVQIGNLTMNINISNLSVLTDIEHKKTPNGTVSFSNTLKSQNVASEINVIGLNVDQAIPIVDKYLDDCYMSNLESVRIVHGKGTGKLRDGIHSFLKKNSRVKSYRMGIYGEGETGVTVVYLK